MTTAVANPDEFGLGKFVGYSLFLHALLGAAIVASIVFHWKGNVWGDVGGPSAGEVKVNLVSGSVGLPMPKPPVIDHSKTFDPTNSLYKEQPQPKPPAPPKDATPIPKFEKEKPPKPIQHPSKVFENKTPPPENAVPGHGGQPNLPTGYSQVPGSASPGMAVTNQAGGDFAGRYPAYVEAIRRCIAHHPPRRPLYDQPGRHRQGHSHRRDESQFILRQFRFASSVRLESHAPSPSRLLRVVRGGHF